MLKRYVALLGVILLNLVAVVNNVLYLFLSSSGSVADAIIFFMTVINFFSFCVLVYAFCKVKK